MRGASALRLCHRFFEFVRFSRGRRSEGAVGGECVFCFLMLRCAVLGWVCDDVLFFGKFVFFSERKFMNYLGKFGLIYIFFRFYIKNN